MDDYRGSLGSPVVILVAYDEGGHEPDSAHYARPGEPWSMAVDCYAPKVPLVDQWLTAERFDFRGIGLYPWWRREIQPGVYERIPGLHLDIRPRLEHPTVGRRWTRDEQGVYHPLDARFLRQILAV